MKISIHLPVSPAIKKYLEVRLGKNYHLTINDWFGGILINMLENKSCKPYEPSNKSQSQKTETFTITVSMSMADKNGFNIQPKHEAQINKIIDDIFREDMYIQAITNKKNYFIEFQTSISNILDSYDITDDEMSYESIKRDFSRKRGDIEKRLFI